MHGDMAILGLIVFYVINALLRSCDYFNDSNFLSLFFELSAGYEAIIGIICRKNTSWYIVLIIHNIYFEKILIC